MGTWSAILATLVAAGCYDQATPGGVFACERAEDCRPGEVCRATLEHPDRLVCASADHPGPDASTALDADGDAAEADGGVDADLVSDAADAAAADAADATAADAAEEEVGADAGDASAVDAAGPIVDLTGPWRGFFHRDNDRLFLLITQSGHRIEARVSSGEYGAWVDEVCEGELSGVVMTCSYHFYDNAGIPWLVEAELTWTEATDALVGTFANQKYPWLGTAITLTRYDPP